ncbi:hypothetical protein JMUB7507_26550 [Staphylococcus aureus]
MEYIARAGVISVDINDVYPRQTLTEDELATLKDCTINFA